MQVQVLSCALSQNVAVFCDVFLCACTDPQTSVPESLVGDRMESRSLVAFDSRPCDAMVNSTST